METKTVIFEEKVDWVAAPAGGDIIMGLAEKNHWIPPQVVGSGGMISETVVMGNWRYEPLIDSTIIPKKAQKRIDLILESNIHIEGFIIGHEIEIETRPKLKPWVVAPDEPDEPKAAPQLPRIDIDWETVGTVATVMLSVAGVLLGVLATFMAVMGDSMASSVCGLDPMVIVVIDGEWWGVYEWYS